MAMTPEATSAAQIVAGLARLGTYMRGWRWRRADALGLTPTQSQILLFLSAQGSARITALAGEIAAAQPTASDAVAALIRKGLAEKRSDPRDGRAIAIAATAKGLEQAQAIPEGPAALLEAVHALPEGERALLLRTLTQLIRSLQNRGEIPAQRLCVTCRFFRPNVYSNPQKPHHCAFVNAAFGDAALRLDCGEHEPADPAEAGAAWRRFAGAEAAG